jgi:hypothetical protein
MTTAAVEEYKEILSVGDTTYLDYRSIKEKREGYGPTGNGGNGLILHSALAIDPQNGQSLGLLWQKLWNREQKPKPPKDETVEAKKQRQKIARTTASKRSFEEKESYRWVEAMLETEKKVEASTRLIHVFDREGDITEVFDQVRQLKHTGVLVRAAHDRSLDKAGIRWRRNRFSFSRKSTFPLHPSEKRVPPIWQCDFRLYNCVLLIVSIIVTL